MSRLGWTRFATWGGYPRVLSTMAALLALGGGFEPARAQDAGCPAWEGRIVGHRGSGVSGSGEPYPENTLVSFEAAYAEGADAVELDVHLASDGVPVIMHDPDVSTTTDGTGCVGTLTSAELAALDAGGPNMAGTGIGVPTLASFLAAPGDVNVELKVEVGGACPDTDRAALAAAVAAVLAADAHAATRRVWISSFDAEVLDAYRMEDPDTPVALLTLTTAGVATAIAAGFDGVNPHFAFTTSEAVDEAHAAGLSVWVWTANGEATAEDLAAMGVDAIITDDVTSALAGVAALCAEPTSSGGGCSVALHRAPGGPDGRSGAWLGLLPLLGVASALRWRRRSRASA